MIDKRMGKREIEKLVYVIGGWEKATRKGRLEVALGGCYASFQSPGSPWFTE